MNEIYEAPVLEVLNVVVEAGFQASIPSTVLLWMAEQKVL